MTNLEALQGIVGNNYPFNPNAFDKNLIDQGLNRSDIYTVANMKAVDLAAVGLINTLITSVDVSEGGYKITVGDRADLLKLRSSLLAKYGISDGSATINDASDRW